MGTPGVAGHPDLQPYSNAYLNTVFGALSPFATFSNVHAAITLTIFRVMGMGLRVIIYIKNLLDF